jgi:SAM-dependent methyltransferase
MTHPQQQDFIKSVKDRYPSFFKEKRVLEIGSRSINGTVRGFFKDCDYTGVDAVEGDCVDVVGEAHKLDYAPKSFDVVISAECLEHDPYWPLTVEKMCQWVKEPGLLVITCATTGRQEHGTHRTDRWVGPQDHYYQNIPMLTLLGLLSPMTSRCATVTCEVNNSTCDLYYACKTRENKHAKANHRDGTLP